MHATGIWIRVTLNAYRLPDIVLNTQSVPDYKSMDTAWSGMHAAKTQLVCIFILSGVLLINCSDCLPVTCYYLIEYHLCTHLLSGHVPGLSCSVWFSVLVLAAFPTSCTCSVELIDRSIVVIVVVVHCDGLSVDDIT